MGSFSPHGKPCGPERPGATTLHRRQHRFLRRFVAALVLLLVLLMGGLAALAWFFTRVFGGGGPSMLLLWLSGLGLALLLPLSAFMLGFYMVRQIAMPLAGILAAIEAVADGNLQVRVPERGYRDMRRLAQSVNRMIAELARTDQQRRNLTADVAHELRTPLHIIQGNLEGILDGVYEPTPEHIEATLEESRLLARLVEDLRTLSLAESGELPLRREPVDVDDLLADVATSFSGQAEASGIDLRVLPRAASEDESAQRVVRGDADRLDQVLSNLVANAVRHTPPGGSVTLSARVGQEGAHLLVEDTGEGIAPEDLPFVFDRFWQGDESRSHRGGAGSGLGLAIAAQLVQAHGGAIEVSSERYRGTRFRVTLPSLAAEGIPE